MVQNINIRWHDCSCPSTKLQEGNVFSLSTGGSPCDHSSFPIIHKVGNVVNFVLLPSEG